MEGQTTSAPTNSPAPQTTPSSTDGTAAVANGSNRQSQTPKTQTNPITENQNQTQTTGQTPIPTSTQPPEYFDIPVNGQMRRMTKEQVLARASLADRAYEKFEEASQIRKTALHREEQLKKDFMEALTDPKLGLSKEQIRSRFEHWYKENFIDPETLTPDQKRARELENQLKSYQEKEKLAETERQQQEIAKLDEDTRVRIQKTIFQALEQGKLPKTRFTAARMAYWMKVNNQNGFNATPEILVQQVVEERNNLVKEQADNADGDSLYSILGKENVNKILKHALSLVQGGQKPPAPPKNPREPQENERKSMGDVEDYFRSLRVKRNY
jgi:hypothetical protein